MHCQQNVKIPLYYSLQPNTEKAKLDFETCDAWGSSLEEIQHVCDTKTKWRGSA